MAGPPLTSYGKLVPGSLSLGLGDSELPPGKPVDDSQLSDPLAVTVAATVVSKGGREVLAA